MTPGRPTASGGNKPLSLHHVDAVGGEMDRGQVGLNFPAMWFDLFRVEIEADSLPRILDALSEGIRGCEDAIRHAGDLGKTKYVDNVVDSECDMLEELLGMAFVACQVSITRVVSRVHEFRQLAADGKGPLKGTGGKKEEIMYFGSGRVKETGYTQVQIIDAFANYYKHRDGWRGSWDKLKDPRQKKAADIIRSVGATEGSTGNLRTGAKALGNLELTDLNVFLQAIRSWQDAQRAQCWREFTSRGLL